MNSFLFATCQVGAEIALKHDAARAREPELKFAYSRPGFLTFKVGTEARPSWTSMVPSIFARATGVVLGKELAAQVPRRALSAAQEIADRGKKVVLHVYERDEYEPGEEPDVYFPGLRAAEMEKSIRAFEGASGAFEEFSEARPGDLVLDVIWIQDAADPASAEWWFAAHRHAAGRSPYPGGKAPFSLPPGAPSRAYLKIQEALDWAGLKIQPGEVAVEVGCAPGGAVSFLLERGAQVVGVDSGEMHESVRGNRRFTHIKKSIADVSREELPDRVNYLLFDINAEPRVTLSYAEKIVPTLKPHLKAAILTLKLNQWKLAEEISYYLRRIEMMGFTYVTAAQLSNHRKEFVAIARNEV